MRDGSTRRRSTSPQQTTWTPERVQVDDWRRHSRLEDLRELAEGASGLAWSRRLLHALLENSTSATTSTCSSAVSPPARQPVPTAARHRAAPATQLVSSGPRTHGHATRTLAPDPSSLGISNNTSRRRPPPSRSGAYAAPEPPSALKGDHMLNESFSPSASTRGHRVRELVCAYRPPRDSDGRVVDVPTVVLKDPRTRPRSSRR